MESLARPNSLAEVASNCRSFDDLSFRLADFLHEFSARPDFAMLTEAPPLLSDAIEFGDVADAYLAATAEALATRMGTGRPEWTGD